MWHHLADQSIYFKIVRLLLLLLRCVRNWLGEDVTAFNKQMPKANG